MNTISFILSCNDVNNKIHRDINHTYTHIRALCNILCRQLIKQSIPYNISLPFQRAWLSWRTLSIATIANLISCSVHYATLINYY